MAHVFLDMTQSLDGYTCGPDISVEHPLGRGGGPLHAWLFGDEAGPPDDLDREIAGELFAGTGAFLIGRRTFDVGIGEWGEDGAFGRPCFVVTHRPRAMLTVGPTTFAFVTDGIESALAQARAAAGDQNVCVMGGGELAAQYLRAGLIDQLRLHLAHLLLGQGGRLFDGVGVGALRATRAVQTRLATHLRFELRP
ncbi:MAG: dihydrofolate reductase family protein [Phenylobacterium sp.]|uniref:dihydrofolate reductase family protein n=1 Tax=Phenylobacterium sp. TaxID=1871053 RepID=UPI0027349994|nr:dihydrofolate reductase family protein [Phenylobacterium sp.]MDP3746501.1 dihydrofolate reductase family protein [Phenylobacterium sp.]